MPRHEDYDDGQAVDGNFREQPHSSSAHFVRREPHEERNNNRNHPTQGNDWRRSPVAHNNTGARHNPSTHPYHHQERPQQQQQQQQQQDIRSASNENRLGRRMGNAQHRNHSPERRASSPRRPAHDDYDHHRTKRIRSPDNHNGGDNDLQQPNRLSHQRHAPSSHEGTRPNNTIPTGPSSHQRRGFTPQDRMMSPGPSSQQRRPLPPQDQVVHKAGAPSRKNSFDQDYESQRRRGHGDSNDGSNHNNHDGYAYDSQPNRKNHSSEQGHEPWRNSGAGQNSRERSGSFNDNFSSNYSRGVNTAGSKGNTAGFAQRATGYSRGNNHRSRSRSSSRSDQTRTAPYRRDNLSPRLRRTGSSHSPTPDRRSPREDFKSHHHSPDSGRYGQNHGYDRGQSHESQYGERRRKISSPTPADTRHTPQWTPHVPGAIPAVVQSPQVYGGDEAYQQQMPYYPAATPIPYAALLASSPAFVQGLAQLSALLTPQQTPPIESLYSIASALVSEAAQTTTTTVLGPALLSMETGGSPAAATSAPSALEGHLYAKSSPSGQASQPDNFATPTTSQVTSTPLQVNGGASDALLARLSDPVTARLLQSISPFLSQIPSTNVASSQPTASLAPATPAAPQPVQSYPEPQRLDSESGALDQDSTAGNSSQTTNATSVSAFSLGSSENDKDASKDASKEPAKTMELLVSKHVSDSDDTQPDLKLEHDVSFEASNQAPAVKDSLEEPATITAPADPERILTRTQEQTGTDLVAVKAEKDGEPQIAFAGDVDTSIDVSEGDEPLGVAVEQALMKREPSIELYSVSLENPGSGSTETGLAGLQNNGKLEDSSTSAKTEIMERTSLQADEPSKAMLPVAESAEATGVESGIAPVESRFSLGRAVEGVLEQNNVPQELDHFREPSVADNAPEGTETVDSGMELDHTMDGLATETSAEKPKAKVTSASEPDIALVSTDMELEEFPTVPDVENSSPGPTSSCLTDDPPANDHDSSSSQDNQPPNAASPSRTLASARREAQAEVRVYPSWHHVPGADIALLSEMRASTADLGRFRRETRWLEERVSRPRRDAVSEDMFDKALGLTRMVPLLRPKWDHQHQNQDQGQGQDQDQDRHRPQPRSRHDQDEKERHMAKSFGAAVRLSADSRLAYSTFRAQLMEEMEEQLRLESEQTALQRAVERTETKIKLKQRLGEQAEQKMREVLEKQAELDMELEKVRKMEQEYLERREQQRKRAEEEIRQLEDTLRALQEHHDHLHLQQPQQEQQQQQQQLQQQLLPPNAAAGGL